MRSSWSTAPSPVISLHTSDSGYTSLIYDIQGDPQVLGGTQIADSEWPKLTVKRDDPNKQPGPRRQLQQSLERGVIISGKNCVYPMRKL